MGQSAGGRTRGSTPSFDPQPDKPSSRSSAHGHEAISPPTLVSFYASQAIARHFVRAKRKDAEAAGSSSKPCPGYGGAINYDCLKHKITELTKNEKSEGSSSSASMFTPAELTAKAMSMGPPHKRPLDLKTRGSPSDQPPNPESPRKKYKTEIQMMLQTSLSLVTWSLTTSTKLSYHNL